MKENFTNPYSPYQRSPTCLIGRDALTAKDRLSVHKWGWITLRIGRAKRWWRRKGKRSFSEKLRLANAMIHLLTTRDRG